MSTQIPETKWIEISIDFVTDLLPSANGHDSMLVTADKVARMVHLAPCKKISQQLEMPSYCGIQ